MPQHNPPVKRRRTTALIALPVALAIFATGCAASEPTPDASADEPVTLVVGIQTETNVNKPYRSTFDAFTAENPNITIEVVETPNADYPSVIRTQLQAGSAPDVIYGSPGSGNPNSLLPYATAGYLLDLTDDEWAKEAVPDSAKSLYYQDDKLWALPLDIVPITWGLNQTVFDELGFDYAETLDDVFDQCKSAREQGSHLVQLAGSTVPNTGIFALQVAASRVYAQDPEWNQKRADGEVSFADSAGWKDTLQTVIDMHDLGCFQDGVEGGTFDDLFSVVAQGDAASMFAPAGLITDLKALNPEADFSVIAFPGDKASDTFLFASPSNALGINAATEHPEAAKKLLEYFAQPSTQDEFAERVGNASLGTVLRGESAAERFSFIEPYLTDASRNAPLANLFWPNGEVYNQLGVGIQGLLTGQATIDAVLAAMDEAWDNS